VTTERRLWRADPGSGERESRDATVDTGFAPWPLPAVFSRTLASASEIDAAGIVASGAPLAMGGSGSGGSGDRCTPWQ